MSNWEDRYEIAGRTKPGLFNRSMTLHTTTPKASVKKKLYDLANATIRGNVKKLKSARSMVADRVPGAYNRATPVRLDGADDRVVVYLTSLRGVRRTHDDCHAVKMIFRGFRVWVDERDIVMDSAYRRELQGLLHEKNVSLPQVFIRGRYIGGAEAVKHLFEIGELSNLLEGFPVLKPGVLCDGCGDVRFLPCINCSGSRKFFDEDEGLVMRCWVCNENGLIRCPDCSG